MPALAKLNPNRIRTSVGSADLVALQRARLVEMATRLFRSNGFHATSTRDIAREAGVSAGAIYQYIKTKEDLLTLIFHVLLERHERELYPVMDDTARGIDRLWDAMGVYYRVLDAHHDKAHVLYMELQAVSRPLRQHLRQTQDRIFSGFEGLLRQGMDEGVFREADAHFLAQNIVAMGQAWALRPDRFAGMAVDDYIAQEIALLKALLIAPRRGARRT
jgi:AcrR family transcriptional regulator